MSATGRHSVVRPARAVGFYGRGRFTGADPGCMAGTPAQVSDPKAFASPLSDPDFFTEVLDCLTEAVYIVDRARTIRFWNQGCEQLTGYSAADVVGRRCFEDILRHVNEEGQRLSVGLCPLAHTMRDGQPRRTRVWFHHKLGHRVSVNVAARSCPCASDSASWWARARSTHPPVR
jgi:PAS domain S-box-containing protein